MASTTTATSKQAVVFLLDSYKSMTAPYSASKSRFACATEALETWISNLMIQSKQHEVGVIVLKSPITEHHLSHEHFPNLQLLLDGGMTRPTVQLLREINQLQCSTDDDDARRGDVMDGLVLAADVLRRRTAGKKYARSIVILTDATHRVAIDEEQVLQVVDSLRELQCQLHVIGLDFTESAVFDTMLPESEAAGVKQEDESSSSSSSSDDETDGGSEDDSDDDDAMSQDSDDDDDLVSSKIDTEKFLISVARLTGGSVRAVDSLQQVLSQNLGKRIATSTRRKVQLTVAPTIPALDVRVSLLLSKTNLPSLKKEATLLDEATNLPLKDGLGNYITSELQTSTDHFDATEKQVGVEETGRTKAVKYGSDFIPLNDFDLQGLKDERSEVAITLLGYTSRAGISRAHLMGPPYGVSGGDDSVRACAAVSALAQAMCQRDQCAIGTYIKSAHADPQLVALFPLQEEERMTPHRLVLLQLPFHGDVLKVSTLPLEHHVTPEKQAVCEDLVDALMLPAGTLESTKIPNPAIRNFRKTLMHRAIAAGAASNSHNDDVVVVDARGDWFQVPGLKNEAALNKFRQTFPIKMAAATKR